MSCCGVRCLKLRVMGLSCESAAFPLIITNSKAKKKGAHFEHLNYHLLSILIVVYHDLFPDAEVSENVLEGFLRGYAFFARYLSKVVDDHAEVFGEEVAAETKIHRSDYTLERFVSVEQGRVVACRGYDYVAF